MLALLALCAVVLGLWTITRLSSYRIAILKFRLRVPLAEHLAGTRLQSTRWAQLLLANFGQTDAYRSANRALPPGLQGRVVLYGDSIIQFWPTVAPDTYFHDQNFLNRGISGQTTPALLWRFQTDVLDLHPTTVVLLGGTNDITRPNLHISAAETEDNLRKMALLATQHGIRVLLCSVPPTHDGRKSDAERVAATNVSLQTYAAQNHIIYVDYFHALADAHGEMPLAFSPDGIHPNHAGYQIMAHTLSNAIAAITPTRIAH